MQPPKSKICVICGVEDACTREHIPPRGFFKGTSGQFRTVPACSKCNNASSEDDEELRNYISAQVGKQTLASRKLWDTGAHESLKRSGKLRSRLLDTTREIEVMMEDGSTAKRLGFFIPIDLYQRVFERITRGLHFWHTSSILPREVSVKIELLGAPPDIRAPEIVVLEHYSVSDDAFEYRFSIESEDPTSGVWLYTLYKAHWVYGITGALETV